jgi:hypothetical protein
MVTGVDEKMAGRERTVHKPAAVNEGRQLQDALPEPDRGGGWHTILIVVGDVQEGVDEPARKSINGEQTPPFTPADPESTLA